MCYHLFQEYLVPSTSSLVGLDQKSLNRDDSDDDDEGGGELDLTDIDDAEIGNYSMSFPLPIPKLSWSKNEFKYHVIRFLFVVFLCYF